MLKIINVQNVYLNNKKVTLFDVYQLIDKAWIFDYNSSISHGADLAQMVLDMGGKEMMQEILNNK